MHQKSFSVLLPLLSFCLPPSTQCHMPVYNMTHTQKEAAVVAIIINAKHQGILSARQMLLVKNFIKMISQGGIFTHFARPSTQCHMPSFCLSWPKCTWRPGTVQTCWGFPKLPSWICRMGWGKGRIERGKDKGKKGGWGEEHVGKGRDEVGREVEKRDRERGWGMTSWQFTNVGWSGFGWPA